MALAFRAAAGEVPFIDNTGTPYVKDDWEKIDADIPAESSERCKRLLEKIDLIAKEIEIVDSDTERRLALTAVAEMARSAAQKKIIDAENEVRSTFVSKKKKPNKKGESIKVESDADAKTVGGGDSLVGDDRDGISRKFDIEVTHTDMIDEQSDA